MKWIVQLDYEFGEFEPNSIYFRRVCSDDIEYSSAYDTKREALEAFCQGQYAIDQLRKEKQAEQKKEEGWDKAIKEAKEKYGYGKPEGMIDVIKDFSPKQEAEQKKEEKKKTPCEGCENAEWYPHGWHCKRFGRQIKMDRETCIADEREEEQRKFVDLSRYCKTAIFDPSKPTIDERLEALEKRLTEIEGVLSSIGSPEWDLRKKVEALEIQAKHFAFYIPNVSYELKNE